RRRPRRHRQRTAFGRGERGAHADDLRRGHDQPRRHPHFRDVSDRAWHRHRGRRLRSEEHTSELQSHFDLVCRLLLEKKKKKKKKLIYSNKKIKKKQKNKKIY